MNNPSYCSTSDLRDIYPQVDEFDTKTSVYGWSTSGSLHTAYNVGKINILFINGRDLGSPESSSGDVNATDEWYYERGSDSVIYYNASYTDTTIKDQLFEAGEDWDSHQTDIIQKASSYFDSRVDANLPREQFKDQNGEYDYLVIRTTALITCNFLVKAQNPLSEMIEVFEEEINFNIELINSGKSKLSYQVSGDSSKGFVTEITSPQTSDSNGGLYIIDTRGNYSGTYDRIKVIIETAGVIGTAKYDVYVKDSDNLKNSKVVDAKVINGDYQQCAGGLQIRFQGKNSSSTAVKNDEWEIEVFGQQESLDDNIGAVKYTSMTRTSRPFRKGYGYRF